jgi:membrane protein implicated in regulation of membrane protease activity
MDSMWWFLGALLLGIAEIFTLDLTLLMCAGGALAGAFAIVLGAPQWLAATIAVVVAGLLLFALRPWLLSNLRARMPLVETNAAALVGKDAKALTVITPETGRVKLRGEVWTARVAEGADEIPEGAEVTVVKISGATALVKPSQSTFFTIPISEE